MMRTANPALNADVFTRERASNTEGAMTIEGTANKAMILLVILVMSAGWVWEKLYAQEGGLLSQSRQMAMSLVLIGAVGGFIIALVTRFLKSWSAVTAPIYAVCQGFALGGISAFFEVMYKGIVVQAIALTFGTLFCLLVAYRSGIIKATENFKLGVFAATGAIGLVYLATFVLNFFHVQLPYIHQGSAISIGVSLFVVTIAALNLVLDFDFIEQGARQGAPKYMEWYGAFGLMVTLVWLYMEILRLLAKTRSRR